MSFSKKRYGRKIMDDAHVEDETVIATLIMRFDAFSEGPALLLVTNMPVNIAILAQWRSSPYPEQFDLRKEIVSLHVCARILCLCERQTSSDHVITVNMKSKILLYATYRGRTHYTRRLIKMQQRLKTM